MDIKRIGILGISAILFVVILYFAFGGRFSSLQPSQEEFQPTPSIRETPVFSPSPTPQPTLTALEACIESERKKAGQGVEYDEGSLLVSFKNGVSFSEARKLILSYSLKYDSGEDRDQYNANGWLTVFVPETEEFKSICVLKSDQKVKNAILNTLFSLHE